MMDEQDMAEETLNVSLAMDDVVPTSRGTLVNPYVGPRSFTTEQRAWFNGRDKEAHELLSLLQARRLALFYSQSGAGKTSLLNARLIPMLQEEGAGFEVLPVGRVGDAVRPPAEVGDSFNIFTFNLLVSLGVGFDAERDTAVSLSDFLLDTTYDGQQFTYHPHASPEEPEATTAPEGNLDTLESDIIKPRALIIDQFEEIFTVHPEQERARIAFFKQVAEAMEQDPYLYILFSMRGDYIDRLSPYVKLLPGSLRTRYYMERMREEAALQAVQRPAEVAGRPFMPDVAQKLVQYLRRLRVTTSAVDTPQDMLDPYVETVQLQVVCFQLWLSLREIPGESITMADVNQVAANYVLQSRGRALTAKEQNDPLAIFIDTALASYYEQAVQNVMAHAEVTVSEHALRHWFSQKLITPASIRNLLPRGEQETEGIPDLVVSLLDTEHYLIRNDMRGGRPFIELVHDSFIEPIRRANRQWEKARNQQIPWLAAAYRYHENPDQSLLLGGENLKLAQTQAREFKGLPPEAESYLKASEEAWQANQAQLQQRELAQQKALADAESRRADEAERAVKRERYLLFVAMLIGVIAIIFAVRSQYQAQLAEQQTELAEQQTELVVKETTRTAEQAAIAATAQAELDNLEATRRAEQVADLEARAAAEAVERERLASLVESVSLTGKAESFLNRDNIPAALLFSLMAISNTPNEEVVQEVLVRVLNKAGNNEFPLTEPTWETNLEEWQAVACALAGRNLTLNEWQEAFPVQQIEAYPLICDEFPRHHSINVWLLDESEKLLAKCNQSDTEQARNLYREIENPQVNFEDIAVSIPLQKSLEAEDEAFARQCAEMVYRDDLLEQWLDIRASVRQHQRDYKRFNFEDYSQQREALAKPEVALALLDEHVAQQLYQTPCFDNELVESDRVGACTQYNNLIQRSGLTTGFLPLMPSQLPQEWNFTAQAGDFVALRLSAAGSGSYPYLILYSPNGEQIGFNEGYETAVLERLLVEDGLYTVLADWSGTANNYTLLAERMVSTPITLGDSNVLAEAEQRLWQFEANPGDIVALRLSAAGSGSYPSLTLYSPNGQQIGFNEGFQTAVLQRWLEEEGLYTVRVDWQGTPSNYTLSTEPVVPAVIALGENRSGNTNDVVFWYFDLEETTAISISMIAVDDSLDPFLHLLDEGGMELVANDDGGEGFNSLINTTLEPGRYFIRSVSFGSTSGAYELKLAVDSLSQAILQIRQGQVLEGLAVLRSAGVFEEEDSLRVDQYNEICWFGSLWGFAAEVLFACETAVTLAPDHEGIADSYGVALALLERTDEALPYFRQFVNWAGASIVVDQRQEWIQVIEAGGNPFFVDGEVNEELLQTLLDE